MVKLTKTIKKKNMKLFTSAIDKKLFSQYALGSDLSKQLAVVKIFNPTGTGTWFIINSDPDDPDYLWAIVDLGYGAEVGSVSRSQLENYRGRFGLGFERDTSFTPINAEEVLQGLLAGEFFANGGNLSDEAKEMLINQNEQIDHHSDELEDILKKPVRIPAWVIAKMGRATADLSDVVHYLDGKQEMIEDLKEEEEENEMGIVEVEENSENDFKEEFSEMAFQKIKGFLKGKNDVVLKDDMSFEMDGLEYYIAPMIQTKDSKVVSAFFNVFDNMDNIVGEIDYTSVGGNRYFRANSRLLGWTNTKFENGGFMANVYANGGDVKQSLYHKEVRVEKKDFLKFKEMLNEIGLESPYYEDISDKQFNIKQVAFYFKNEKDRQKAFNHYHKIFADGGFMAFGGDIDARKMYLGDPVIYDGELWYVSEKNGIVGLVNMKQGAWGSNYPFIPISRIMVSQQVTDMMGRKVRIPYLVEDFEKGAAFEKGGCATDAYLFGGQVNGSLNLKAKKMAEDKGITIDKLGKKEYDLTMYQALIEALTDANFHDQALNLAKILADTENEREAYNSEYFTPSKLAEEYGRGVARLTEWDGFDIMEAFYYVTSMEGSGVGRTMKLYFAKNNFTPDENIKFNVGDVVYQKDEKRYATIMNNYGNPVEGDYGEVRLDTSGNTSIFTQDRDGLSNGYNLVKLGAKGDSGKFTQEVLDEMKESAKNLIDSRAKAKDKEGAETYKAIYKRLLSGEFDSMVVGSKQPKKYVLKADIKTVTVKRDGKEVTYKGSDVFNGANILMNGGELSKKAFYVPKRDVVEVELKDGKKINPANGYWVKKDAKPIDSEGAATKNVAKPITRIQKDARGNWNAITTYEDHQGYDWKLSTFKNFKGQLITSVQAGRVEESGSSGVKFWKFAVHQDPHFTLIVTKPSRVTEKVVTEQHDKGVEIFGNYMETGEFKYGGKISNFEKLSMKVAKQYVGKPVKSEYQEQYGKYYSEQEAKEVGDKVAGKVKAQQSKKMFFGGMSGKSNKANFDDKQGATKDGKAVHVLSHDGDSVLVMDMDKLGTGAKPYRLNVAELDESSFFKNGGKVGAVKSNFKQAVELAKKIRKENESWQSALKRAFAEIKK